MTFNQKIRIQKRTEESENNAIERYIWQDFKTAFAFINNLYGNDYYAAAAVGQENIVIFTMRYSSFVEDLNPYDYRIIFNDKIYKIKTIDHMEYGKRIVKIRAVKQ